MSLERQLLNRLRELAPSAVKAAESELGALPATQPEDQRPADLLDDLWDRQHRMNLSCWCGPVQDGIGIYHRNGKVTG